MVATSGTVAILGLLPLLEREASLGTNGSPAGCFLKTSFIHWHFNCSLTLQLTHWHFNWLIDTSTDSLTLLQREPGFVTNGSAAGCFLKTSFTHWHFNCSLTLQLTHWHFNWLIDTSGTVAARRFRFPTPRKPTHPTYIELCTNPWIDLGSKL